MRTLKRHLRSLGLRKKGNAAIIDNNTIRAAIQEEINGPGELSGYRSIWHALRLRHHIHVPRNLVAEIMKEIDPSGVKERRARRLKRRTFRSKGQTLLGIWMVRAQYMVFCTVAHKRHAAN